MLNRWGHAYVNPQPGFFFGVNGKPAPRDVLRNRPHGRIAFANADLAGASDHRNSIREADRGMFGSEGALGLRARRPRRALRRRRGDLAACA